MLSAEQASTAQAIGEEVRSIRSAHLPYELQLVATAQNIAIRISTFLPLQRQRDQFLELAGVKP